MNKATDKGTLAATDPAVEKRNAKAKKAKLAKSPTMHDAPDAG
jgi:hypothetical protein